LSQSTQNAPTVRHLCLDVYIRAIKNLLEKHNQGLGTRVYFQSCLNL